VQPMSYVLFVVFLATLLGLASGAGLEAFLSDKGDEGRSLERFTKGSASNGQCWDRYGHDGFQTVVDVHNHFQPFEGPNVPFAEYMEWMTEHGILFSTMMGLGQKIQKSYADLPDCCYYLHCPTFNYTVVPTTANDILNFGWYNNSYRTNKTLQESIVLIPSATFPNLQVPDNNTATLDQLITDYPNTIRWVGEVNIYKHALAANGFWNFPKVTEASFANDTALAAFLRRVAAAGWPMTIHCDLGCDNYAAVPGWDGRCVVGAAEAAQAHADAEWWRTFLGPYYGGFFNSTDHPQQNFRKIQHLKVWDAVLTQFPTLKVVWAHMGLSKELLTLHPTVHTYIMQTLFDRHPNLHVDLSWDIIAQLYLMNYANVSIQELQAAAHEDLHEDSETLFNSTMIEGLRSELAKVWEKQQAHVETFGSAAKIDGPTHAMAIYYVLIDKYDTRFLTGTDFVSSMGPPGKWPGLSQFKSPPTGCMKDAANHARQLTDTSSINMFLDDEAFRNIVLGGNFFRLTGLDAVYQPPAVCRPPAAGNSTVTVITIISTAGAVQIATPRAVLVGLVLCVCFARLL